MPAEGGPTTRNPFRDAGVKPTGYPRSGDSCLLDLSTLPDGGESILDLDDGDGPAPLPGILTDSTGASQSAVFVGANAMIGLRHRVTYGGPDRNVLDCRRPSVQAHLCRWLAWRVTGRGEGLCVLRREPGGVWVLMDGDDYRIASWPEDQDSSYFGCNGGQQACAALASITDVPSALVALVKAHATSSAGPLR